MEGILEVFCAAAPTVTIVDAKDLKFGPEFSGNARLLLRRLDYVENDRDSILIGLSHNANIRICSKRFYHAEGLGAYLTCLEEGKRAVRLILLQKLGNMCLDTL